ncbi:hypothetical protein DERF_005611 [Dermatophagoides farinae]|uniref:Uncharacterized protein n=1 Tax=Dermatophagoides farinae TaxID=6954 RepID=A0A922I3U1_DERFA|nr:hypothetical protein DERF_005611 [Dermatophagoides farinae]
MLYNWKTDSVNSQITIFNNEGEWIVDTVEDVVDKHSNEIQQQLHLQQQDQDDDDESDNVITLNGATYVEFAIGDISSNWLNTRKEAEQNDIIFTRPIYISTMKVLLTKSLFKELIQRKRRQCQMDLQQQKIRIDVRNHSDYSRFIDMNHQSIDCAIILNKSNNNNNDDEMKNGQFYFNYDDDNDVNEMPMLTIHDIFNQADLVRVIFKGGAVHRFYSTINIDYLNDLIIVERSSLSTLLQRLQRQRYVLIDESKFIDYFVDHHDCEYTSIDVARRQRIWLEMKNNKKNVHFDIGISNGPTTTSNGSSVTTPTVTIMAQQLTIRKEELFQNNIAIAFSKTFIDKSFTLNNNQEQRNWLNEFDHTLDMMDKEGILQQIRDRHWLNNCRREGRQQRQMSSLSSSLAMNSMINYIKLNFQNQNGNLFGWMKKNMHKNKHNHNHIQSSQSIFVCV